MGISVRSFTSARAGNVVSGTPFDAYIGVIWIDPGEPAAQDVEISCDNPNYGVSPSSIPIPPPGMNVSITVVGPKGYANLCAKGPEDSTGEFLMVKIVG
jgi:hypothetical protein